MRRTISWSRTLGPNGKKCLAKGFVLLRKEGKKRKKIILLIRILRRAVCPTVPRIYLPFSLAYSRAYLQVEAPARHPQLFVDVTYTCVITDMQLSLRIHPTRAALVVRTEEFFYINSFWTVTSLFTFHHPLSALPFTLPFSFFRPLPCFWRSWPHLRIFRFRGLLIGSDCIVNGGCQLVFHGNFCPVNASARVRFKSVIFFSFRILPETSLPCP